MSLTLPGEAERKLADLAASIERLTPKEIVENGSDLVSWIRDHPRTPPPRIGLVFRALAASASDDDEDSLGEVTAILLDRDATLLKKELGRAARTPKARERLAEALVNAGRDIYPGVDISNDPAQLEMLVKWVVGLKASSVAERLVVELTTVMNLSAPSLLPGVVRRIAASRQPLRVSTKLQTALASALGQFADPSEIESLRLIGTIVPKLGLKGVLLERVLAQCIPGAMGVKDDATLTLLLGLVPRKVTWEILAYNLACCAAVQGDKPRLLEATKVALELGKPPERFRRDTDFAAFMKDRDFLALLTAKR